MGWRRGGTIATSTIYLCLLQLSTTLTSQDKPKWIDLDFPLWDREELTGGGGIPDQMEIKSDVVQKLFLQQICALGIQYNLSGWVYSNFQRIFLIVFQSFGQLLVIARFYWVNCLDLKLWLHYFKPISHIHCSP